MDELLKTIEKAKADLAGGVKYPNWKSRRSKEFMDTLRKLCDDEIDPTTKGKKRRRLEGRTEAERQRVWDEVVVPNLECWWIDGCAAPTVKGFKVNVPA